MRFKITFIIFFLLVFSPQAFKAAYADRLPDRALLSAISQGNADEVKRLLAAGRNADAVVEGMDQPPINVAAAFQKVEVVKALIAAGAKVDIVDKRGYQPIHYAAEAGDIELVQVLLAAGAKVDTPAGDVPAQQGAQPIHLAAKSGNGKLVQFLLDAGAKVDAKDKHGNTPLYYVSSQDDPNSVRSILLAAGAKKVTPFVDTVKPVWLEVVQPQIRLGVWDKITVKHNYVAKYVVKCETGETRGTTFVAEKTATAGDPPETWEVLFPKDFRYAKKELESFKAINCDEGKQGSKLSWQIYADDTLIDSGTMAFTRNGHR